MTGLATGLLQHKNKRKNPKEIYCRLVLKDLVPPMHKSLNVGVYKWL